MVLFCLVFIQSQGFKTLKSRTRRLQSTSERVAETQNVAPSFVKVIRAFLTFQKGIIFKLLRQQGHIIFYFFCWLINFLLVFPDNKKWMTYVIIIPVVIPLSMSLVSTCLLHSCFYFSYQPMNAFVYLV